MIVVLTDIHGCFEEMKELIESYPKEYTFVICGDLCDRGVDTYSVIDYCRTNNIMFVKGNHDDWFVSWYEHLLISYWLDYGGMETLQSYTKTPERLLRLPQHIQWLSNLPLYIEFKDVVDDQGRYLVVSHSNISNVWHRRNDIKFKDIFKNTCLWSRVRGVKDVKECYFVFGHTVNSDNPRIKNNYSNIDTGCVYGNVLTAFSFPDKMIKQVPLKKGNDE